MTKAVRLEYDGPIAIITNDNVEKHNAFDDDMDLAAVRRARRAQGTARRPRGDLARRGQVVLVGARRVGRSAAAGRAHPPRAHERVVTAGILQLFDIEAPIIVAMQGWSIGGVVPARAALRHPHRGRGRAVHAARGRPRRDPRHRGRRRGSSRSAGTASRPTSCSPAGRWTSTRRYAHGIVSRVVPPTTLDDTAREMAEKIAASPAVTVKMARRVLRHLSEPEVRSSMAEELIAQTFITKSDDLAEFRAARAEGRDPNYTGS